MAVALPDDSIYISDAQAGSRLAAAFSHGVMSDFVIFFAIYTGRILSESTFHQSGISPVLKPLARAPAPTGTSTSVSPLEITTGHLRVFLLEGVLLGQG